MSKNQITSVISIFLIFTILLLICKSFFSYRYQISGAAPNGIAESEVPDLDPMAWIKDWKRPNSPPAVGIQVGHWKNEELPDELHALIGNTGAVGGGKTELESNTLIAQGIADILRQQGIIVDILPATIPPEYWADAFIAIHADGSNNPSVSGYKIAGPWRDITGKSDMLVSLLETEYAAATLLPKDPNITRNMRGYYAFSWWKYEHTIHPMTTAVIVETGFITSPLDRKIIVDQHSISSEALAKGIITYLVAQGLITS